MTRTRQEERWAARPLLASAVRALVLGVPLVGSSVAVGVAARTGLLGEHRWLRLIALLALALAVAAVVERVTRRLLPLAALLKLTMLFPDRAPSRFKVARVAAGKHHDELVWQGPKATATSVAESVLALVAALGAHDRKTRGHSERVRVFADMVSEELKLPAAHRDRLRWSALLHDLGKLHVPAVVLNKPAKLDDDEFALIKRHPVVGAELAAALLPWLGEWGHGIMDHHERYDGRGYPNGAAGPDISLAGRIIGVVDSFETMTAARPYKKPMATKVARQELAACAGSQFDPMVVRAFLGVSLPKLIWAMGPLSFVVQAPFLRSIAEAGARTGALGTQAAATAASAAVLATTAAVTVPALQPPQSVARVAHSAASADPTTSPLNDPANLVRRPSAGTVSAAPSHEDLAPVAVGHDPDLGFDPLRTDAPPDASDAPGAAPAADTTTAGTQDPPQEPPFFAPSKAVAPDGGVKSSRPSPPSDPATSSPQPAAPLSPTSPTTPEPASSTPPTGAAPAAPSESSPPVVTAPLTGTAGTPVDPGPSAPALPTQASAGSPTPSATAPAASASATATAPAASASATASPAASPTPTTSTASPTPSATPPAASASATASPAASPTPTAASPTPTAASPTPTASPPADDSTSSSPDSFITSGPAATTSSTTATFTFAPGHDYECSLNGEDRGWTDCGSSKSYRDLDEGLHTFKIRTVDGGSRGPVEHYRWTIIDRSDTSDALIGLRGAAADVRGGLADVVDGVRDLIPTWLLRTLELLVGLVLGLLRRLFG